MPARRCAAWTLAVAGAIAPASAFAQECPTFAMGANTGTPNATELAEISGMVASRRREGVLWVHNDSGDSARIFAISTTGTLLATFTLQGAGNVDWEDLAIEAGVGEAPDRLYVGDIGDNLRQRETLTVYRVEEPLVAPGQEPVSGAISSVESFTLAYPEAPDTVYDCEAMFVDPRDGALVLITKQAAGESVVQVFRGVLQAGATTTLEHVVEIANLGSTEVSRVTGADISPGGGQILLRQYFGVRYWRRGATQQLSDALAAPPCVFTTRFEVQSEAIAFAPNGLDYYTTSERPESGALQPIRFHQRLTGLGEPALEGEGGGEGGTIYHSADEDEDGHFSLTELLGVVQLFNAGVFHCAEGGYMPGEGPADCQPHTSDFREPQWQLDLSELLRSIQLFSVGGFLACGDGESEDGFCFS